MSLFGQGYGNRGYGFSLKALLQDPNLQNAPQVQSGDASLKKPGYAKHGGYIPNANSAFLGPNLWEQPSSTKTGDFDLQYMDLDEFLSENGIPVDPDETNDAQTISLLASALAKTPPSSPQRSSPGLDLHIGPISPQDHSRTPLHCRSPSSPGLGLYLPDSPIRRTVDPLSLSPMVPSSVDQLPSTGREPVRMNHQGPSTSTSPQSEIEKCLLDENFGIKSPVVEIGRKKIKTSDVDFTNLKSEDLHLVSIPAYGQKPYPVRPCGSPGMVATQRPHSPEYDSLSDIADSDSEMSQQSNNRFRCEPDLTQACVPGQENFDPKKRKFSEEELKPQPIIKKSKKVFVDDSAKDEKYWSRRKKNNVAAKRSRDARRVKENQIAMRAAFLESRYEEMKIEIEQLKKENKELIKRLSKYEMVDTPKSVD